MSDPFNGESNGGSPSILSANYRSSNGNEAFSVNAPLNIPSSTASSPEKKTAYLHSLRGAVLGVQDQVNKELTTRMEQDNLRTQKSANGINDAKEEENYGEEAQEEE